MYKNLAIVCCTNDLFTDKRADKICKCLKELNYNVILVGRKLKNSSSIIREYRIFRFKLFFNKKFLFYSEYNLKLFFFLTFKKPDLIISIDLDTLPACFFSAKLIKAKLIYDSHEYFTEVPELNGRKLVKKIWLIIERLLVPKVKKAITVSESIAEIYYKKYNVKFNVIRNFPELVVIPENKIYNFKKDFNHSVKYILLYQGSLNIGRGIEKLILSIKHLPDEYVIAIIGSGDIDKELIKLVNKNSLQKRVKFYGRIDARELIYYTAGATLGFSLEQNISLNYYYALPNKIFDYINAGIPVICSNFPEMANIVEKYNVGIAINPDLSPENLSDIIKRIISDNRFYQSLKDNCNIAKYDLTWNKEKEKLKKIIEN